ncbi:hypothetical protein DSO57_1000389 [Entomophthora muscae]|uniref:Uncharacterized protein n=1 Tax=Entomophthora muscae TaxID=34485 RepID=A0ACC2UIT3_9FUNG|nr:hypothetical protein DSO57_1000389 [Entomophthora muscae]
MHNDNESMRILFVLLASATAQYVRPLQNLIDELPLSPPSTDPVTTKMRLPSKKNILRFLWYASATYCDNGQTEKWNCTSCKLGNKNLKYYMKLKNQQFNTLGYVALDHEERMILIVFRGTRGIENVLLDSDFIPSRFKYVPDPKNRVHSGFINAMESLAPQFMAALERLHTSPHYRQYKIGIVGHSLGGSMACLAAIKIHTVFQIPWSQIELITYGQPRTGNRAFAEWFDAQPLASARVVNYNDFVPHIYGAFINDFVHHQNEVFFDIVNGKKKLRYCNNKVLEDPKCSNRVPNSEYSILSHLSYMKPGFEAPC